MLAFNWSRPPTSSAGLDVRRHQFPGVRNKDTEAAGSDPLSGGFDSKVKGAQRSLKIGIHEVVTEDDRLSELVDITDQRKISLSAVIWIQTVAAEPLDDKLDAGSLKVREAEEG